MILKLSIKNRLIISGIFIILGVLILLSQNSGFKLFLARASSDSKENVRGWGWSENMGWVSTNCYNDYDDDGVWENCCVDGTDCPYNAGGGNYAVKVSATTSPYDLRGYAWSENMGWICFGKDCDGDPPGAETTSWACLGNRDASYNCTIGDKGENFPDNVNLKAHWNLNDNDSSLQDSVGGNNGTPVGTTRVTGKWGKARSFNGTSDYVLVGDQPDLESMATLTVEAWVKTDENRLNKAIVSKWQTGTASYILRTDNTPGNEGKIGFSVYTSGATNVVSSITVNDNKWHHLAGVYDGTNVKIYIDGVDSTTSPQTTSGSIANSEEEFCLGDTCNGGVGQGNNFEGTIENVSIWSRAKSDSEIFSDGQMELSGWAKVVNLGDNGWMKLQKTSDATPKWWGSYLEDYNGFYRMVGWGWNAYPGSLLGVGWVEYGYPKGIHAPLDFENLTIDNTLGCDRLGVSWDLSTWAENYTYYRCAATDLTGCIGCTYTPYSVIDESCDINGCQVLDTGLAENTGYCYEVVASNSTDDKDCADNPVWKKTLLCEPEGETTNAEICGQIKTKWTKGDSADGYNIYRTLTTGGCNSLVDSNCQSVSHLAEGLSYNGLVAQWKMNQNWNDSSGNGNNGTPQSGPTFNSSGKFGYAGSLNESNSDYVQVANANSLNIANTMTIEAWVKTTDSQGTIASKSDATKGYILSIGGDSTNGKICYWSDGSSWACSTSTVNDNSWHHIAIVHSGTSVYFYKDGVADGSATAINRTNNSTDVLRIGRENTTTRYFNGLIDNVAIYNVTKLDSDIKIDYEAGTNSNCLLGQCGLTYVCGATACGEDNTCCYTDKRVIPKMNYYYVMTQTNEQGESVGSDQIFNQTLCWPTHQQQEQ
ncbi:MAG: LamG domain-containing protein [Patescibacteria group bacterium]|jgi:hypothetical protein